MMAETLSEKLNPVSLVSLLPMEPLTYALRIEEMVGIWTQHLENEMMEIMIMGMAEAPLELLSPDGLEQGDLK
jgi:hypothetical protein